MAATTMAAGSVAGSVAGGLLKKALSDDEKEQEIPQVDPSQALQYYQIGLNNQVTALQSGLQYYETQMQQARQDVTAGLNAATLSLNPLSEAGFTAMNKYMQMLGMDPITETSMQAEKVRQAGFTDLAAKLDAADKIYDPAERAQYKQDVLQQIDTTIQGNPAELDGLRAEAAKYTDILQRANAAGTASAISNPAYAAIDREAGALGFAASPTQSSLMAMSKRLEDINKHIQDTTTSEQAQRAARQQALGGIRSDFESTYGDERPTGYTGEQVMEQLSATPGYEFQRGQGEQALLRQASAAGMLNSGNTSIALSQYNQDYAANAYAGYMSNLAGIVQQGSAATSQIAGMQYGAGQALGGLSQSQGQAGLGAYGAIGQAFQDWGQMSGQTVYDAAKFNTGLKFQGMQQQADRDLKAQQGNQQANLQSGYLGLARDKFNYQKYQSQQMGQGGYFGSL